MRNVERGFSSRRAGLVALTALTALLLAPAAATGQNVAKHSCVEPAIPKQFKNAQERDAFTGRVEAFQLCIKKYTEEQRKLSRAYGDAANEATRDWNRLAARASKVEPAPGK